MKKVAFIAYDDFAMWEVALLQKLLKNCGWQVDTITVDGKTVRTDGGLSVAPDYALMDVQAQDYALLLMPGASGKIPATLIENEALQVFIRTFSGLIAACCASAVFPVAAGKLTGNFTTTLVAKETYASYFSTATFLDVDVCEQDQVITAKGHAHVEFMLKVLEKLGILAENPRIEQIALKLGKNQ